MPKKTKPARASGRFARTARTSLEQSINELESPAELEGENLETESSFPPPSEIPALKRNAGVKEVSRTTPAISTSSSTGAKRSDSSILARKPKSESKMRQLTKESLKRTNFTLNHRFARIEVRAEQVDKVWVCVHFMATQTAANIGQLDFAEDKMSFSIPFEIPQVCIDIPDYMSQDDNAIGAVQAAFRAQLTLINAELQPTGSIEFKRVQSRLFVPLPFKVLTLPRDVDIKPITNEKDVVIGMTILLTEDSVEEVDVDTRCESTLQPTG